ncbi:MAG: hypothetical protein JWQ27_870 [Ferruginibacter sp.]|nr:hypothetical protein [Ferruginibacter sp.]
MKNSICTILHLLGWIILSAQSASGQQSHQLAGMGGYSRNFKEPQSFTINPAALASIKESGLAISGEQPFMLQELRRYFLAGSFKSNLGNFGILMGTAGFKNYREMTFGVGYGHSLGKLMAAGMALDYVKAAIPGYNTRALLGLKLGLLCYPTDQLTLGLHIKKSVVMNKTNEQKITAGTGFTMGAGYEISEQLLVATMFEKTSEKSIGFSISVQYQFAKLFFVRTCYDAAENNLGTAAGIGWKKLRLLLSGSYHPQLGISPAMMILTYF